MIDNELVAVTSRSFSKHPVLRMRLKENFSNVKFNEEGAKLTGKPLQSFLCGATRAIIGLEIMDDHLLSQLPDLKVICKMGTGVDKIDFNAIERYNIAFSHTPGVNKRSVSELVLALTFTLLRHLPIVHRHIQTGSWQQIKGRLLSNKTVGIIGYGAIGRDLATLLQGFNCRCLIYDVEKNRSDNYATQVDLDTLLQSSDIITLHLPLLPENYHFINADKLARMKKGAILINTARGGLVDEQALYQALRRGHLQAAALDVFEHEPDVPSELLSLDNFFATSHIGGSTEEAIEAMGLMAIEQLKKIEIIA